MRKLTVWQALAVSTQFGFLLAMSVLVGFALGWLVDRWTHVGPVALFVGALLGLAAGTYSIVKLTKAFLQMQ